MIDLRSAEYVLMPTNGRKPHVCLINGMIIIAYDKPGLAKARVAVAQREIADRRRRAATR